MFPQIADTTTRKKETSDNEVLADGEKDDDDDDESFISDDESMSDVSADLRCDDDVDVEEIHEIPESGRMAKTIEDYDLTDELFDESGLVQWKGKEKKVSRPFQKRILQM